MVIILVGVNILVKDVGGGIKRYGECLVLKWQTEEIEHRQSP